MYVHLFTFGLLGKASFLHHKHEGRKGNRLSSLWVVLWRDCELYCGQSVGLIEKDLWVVSIPILRVVSTSRTVVVVLWSFCARLPRSLVLKSASLPWPLP